MKRPFLYLLFFFTVFLLFFNSCIKKPVYPSQPVIEYVNFIQYGVNDDSVELVISFTDNEGDIGLEKSDTLGEFKDGNLWMVYFYDSLGDGTVWAPLDTSLTNPQFDTFKIPYRVPVVLPEGDDEEPMKGLIYVKQNPFLKIHDKIRYDVQMKDRAGQLSNKITTPPIDL